MSLRMFGIIAGIAAAVIGSAQDSGFKGPTVGLMFDRPSRAVRAIAGLPGSSYLGASLLDDLDDAYPSPNGQSAIVLRQGSWSLASGITSGKPALQLLDGVPKTLDRVAWSADSGMAALSFSARRGVSRRHGSGGAEAVSAPGVIVVDIRAGTTKAVETPGLPENVTSMVVTKGAGALLIGAYGRSGGGIYRVSGNSQPALVCTMQRPAAIAMATDESVVYVADGGTGDLFQIRNYLGAPDTELVLAGQSDGKITVGLQVSPDGRRLYVAQTGAHVRVCDPATKQVTSDIRLDEDPQSLWPLPGSAYWLLNSRSKPGDTITMLVTSGAQAATFFIPVGE